MSLMKQVPGCEVTMVLLAESQTRHPFSALSMPGQGLESPAECLPRGIISRLQGLATSLSILVHPNSPQSHSLLHSLGGSVGLGGVLGGAVVRSAAGSLEGHRAECTFVENLAVSLLDVAFQQGQSQVDNTTVDAPR